MACLEFEKAFFNQNGIRLRLKTPDWDVKVSLVLFALAVSFLSILAATVQHGECGRIKKQTGVPICARYGIRLSYRYDIQPFVVGTEM